MRGICFAPIRAERLLATAAATVALALGASPAAAQTDPPPLQVTRLTWPQQTLVLSDALALADLEFAVSPHLGLAFPGADIETLDNMEACGMGLVRIDMSWAMREPSDGDYVWGPFDTKVEQLHARGIDLFLTYISDAAWGTVPTVNTARNKVPADMQDWVDFVSDCVERYDLDGIDDMPGLQRPIRYHQFLNEWPSTDNLTGGWAGTIEELIVCMNASYGAVKSASTNTEVVMGGIPAGGLDAMALTEGTVDYTVHAYWTPESVTMTMDAEIAQSSPVILENVALREQVLAACRFDAADLHMYGPVEFNQYRIDRLRQETGSRALLAAECGGPNLAYDEDITPQDHFLAVMDMNLDALARGLEFCLWFGMNESVYIPGDGTTWGNTQVPLIDPQGDPKGGYWAYHLLAAAIQDMTAVQRVQPGAYLVTCDGRPPIYVAWAPTGTGTLTLPGDFGAHMLMRVTDAAQGLFVVEATPHDGVVPLGALPVVVSAVLPGGDVVADIQPSLQGLNIPLLH